ncbi:endonuclease/exonuclease/phosphatase family protein [Geminicoccaceae bacterium 1502E]|nr:endonuclease/exonuclease/phosphatase family protein [Geminicoccaceae bacterium 1502E]
MPVTRITGWLVPPSAEVRDSALRLPADAGSFARAFADFPALHEIEQVPPLRALPPPAQSARIVFWNAERLKYGPASARLLASLAADAILLAEVDLGMARSGNGHTTAELARALGAGWIFGAEFVELGLGDARERAWHAGQRNEGGLHGNAILSRCALARPAMLRLETSGRWFDGTFGERRIGGRMALMAELEVAGTSVLLVSVHYESHTGPADRLAQTRVLLDGIEAHAPGRPVLIGGDFNTSSFTLEQKRDPAFVVRALDEEPARLLSPEAHEPMFGLLAERGFAWRSCNEAGAVTQRTRPDGTPTPPFGRIDWLFTRGLRCSAPATIAATDEEGRAISDHEALAVTIAPDRP